MFLVLIAKLEQYKNQQDNNKNAPHLDCFSTEIITSNSLVCVVPDF